MDPYHMWHRWVSSQPHIVEYVDALSSYNIALQSVHLAAENYPFDTRGH